MIFNETDAFSKDLKALAKKWRTLPSDLEQAQKVIEGLYNEQEGVDRIQFRKNFFDGKTAALLLQTKTYEIVKMRLDCKSPGAQGKARLVFVFVVVADEVVFIELYSKSNKSREDQGRIDAQITETERRKGSEPPSPLQ
jgi:hypothetical protein